MHLCQMHIRQLATVDTCYWSPVYDWQPQLIGKQTIDAAFRSAGINQRIYSSYRGDRDHDRFARSEIWIKSDIDANCRSVHSEQTLPRCTARDGIKSALGLRH